MTPHGGTAGWLSSRSSAVAGFLAVTLLNAALLWHFHDRYWYPTDDGIHAHLAERILEGEVLSREVQDIHPGYVHLLNAAAFKVFGVDLISLRYPLIAASFLQACLIYALLASRGVLVAGAASNASVALGLLQFMSPTANWYCIALGAAMAAWLRWLPRGHRARLVGAGVLLGAITLFRQLTGVWVAMAVLTLGLLEEAEPQPAGGTWLARGLVLAMLIPLVGYLALSPETSTAAVVFFAAGPMAILGWLLTRVRVGNASVVSLVAQVGAGCLLASLPLVAYHVSQGTLISWIDDIVFVATGHTQLPFFGQGWYDVLSIAGLYQALMGGSPKLVANGLYWTAIPLLAAANGWLVVRRLGRGDARELALPVLATFYALVSLYLQGPLYLYYTVGLTIASLLWMTATGPRRRVVLAAATTALSVVALLYHAGQSRHRTPGQILQGAVDTNVWTADYGGLPRAALQIPDGDRRLYKQFIAAIEANSAPDETMIALPNDSELYFLAKRRNATRFYNSTMGLMRPADVRQLVHDIAHRPPRLVVFRPKDKFVTEHALQVMRAVRASYEKIDVIDDAEIYVRTPAR